MIAYKKLVQTAKQLALADLRDARRALQCDEFVPYFQPLVALRTGQLTGFEVLARWQHATSGLIQPAQFIPMAEQHGWIGELTLQILQKSLAAGATLPDPLTLAVNISPVLLHDATLPAQIEHAAHAASFPLSRLIIEITESALIDDLEGASKIIHQIKELGCKLALDDFGTGYSSLLHLQSLPFDELKVDRSFVASMTEKRDSRKIVAAVLGLGQSLGMTTIAEGIETREQAEMVFWLGCDLGQGWLFGKPIPAAELPAAIGQPRQRALTAQSTPWNSRYGGNLECSPAHRLAILQAVYDGAPVGLCFIDPQLRYLNVNQRLADINGVSVEAHLGNTVAEMIPHIFPQVEPFLRRALLGEKISDVEVHDPYTGITRLLSYQPARDEAGEVVGVSVSIVDITELKRVQKLLSSSEDHYRLLVASELQSLPEALLEDPILS